jgi:hypothetical protein
MTVHSSMFLRRILVADAVTSGMTGLALFAGAGLFEALLDVPASLLRVSGLVLIPFAAMVLFFARQITPSRVWTVIGLNAAWVVASAAVLVSGAIQPNGFGVAFVIVQAIAVAVLAELQFAGLRRSIAVG